MVGELIPHLGILKEEHRRRLHMAGDDAVCYLVVPGWLAAAGVMGSAANSVLVDRGALPQRQQVPERLWTNRDPSARIARCIAWQPPEDPDRTPLEGANYERKPLLHVSQPPLSRFRARKGQR